MDHEERLRSALADRYRIEREIGSGGMATVYLAEDLKHRRKVALKVLNPELAQNLGAERFLREIQTAANLTHPHILPLFDSGEADGLLFYVMPFVKGESLRSRLTKEKRLSVDDAIRIIREIADALAEAHRLGIVHRDIKPENVLLSGRHALVADFGVAKAVSESTGRYQLTTVNVAIGTPRYMAPEQASADPNTDHRADLFAAGVVGYEILTGDSPFAGATTQATFAALLTKNPEPVASVREGVPVQLSDAIMRCLEKTPDDRWQSAGELLGELESLSTPTHGVTPMDGSVRAQRRWARPLILASGVLIGAVALWFGIMRKDQKAWAREVALPEIERLVDSGDWYGAYQLAKQAELVIPNDQELDGLRSTFSWAIPVETDPPGARVLRREYSDLEADWEDLGVTPIEAAVTPYGATRWRIELDGYSPVELVTNGSGAIQLKLDAIDALPRGMVRIPSWTVQLDDGQDLELDDFFLDRFEVTNREFKIFVDSGGYERPELWEHRIIENGVTLPWAEGMTRFVDRTGRPGPSTWEIGSYPDERGDLPVGGVSWYEAAAYARFVGKGLPTVHHWRRAFGANLQAWFIPLSNLEGTEAGPVGRLQGVSRFGNYDMAGNVREWTHNAMGSQRFILGGGWNDPDYLGSNTTYTQPALDRSPTNGFRLATYLTEDDALHLAEAPLTLNLAPDFESIEPVSDEVFDIFRRMFEYDSNPLNAAMEAADSTPHWVREKITFDAAYGGEQMVLYLYLPRVAEPPFQTVVYFPGSAALTQRSIEQWRTIHLDFVVKSGRAVAFPVSTGTFERDSELNSTGTQPTALFRDHVTMWAKDMSRSIDYLKTRPDIDLDKLAYYGYSWGGRMAPVMLAVEPRFDAAVLYVAGFSPVQPYAEVDPVNFAPRVTVPVLMLSGQYDDVFPLETFARPMFDRLGTPEQDKKHVVSEGGHFVPRMQLVGEALAWLDRYLGPVR